MKDIMYWARITGVILFLMSMYSCFEASKRDENTNVDSTAVQLNIEDSLRSNLWVYDAQEDRMLAPAYPQSISLDTVMADLRAKYSDIIAIDFERLSQDTIYIRIPNASRMTSSMGSTGAFGVMSEITYSLTAVKGIRYVNFDFEEGDHASPGVYQRSDFYSK